MCALVLAVGEEAGARDRLLEEDGVAVGGALVTGGRDHAVAVRVDEGRVLPRGRVAELTDVELAQRHHGVLRLSVDRVAVDVERGVELVVRAVLLELTDGRADDGRVHDAQLRGGVGVVAQLARLGLRLGLEVLFLDVVDAVGGLRAIEVALVVLAFERELVGAHLEGGDGPRDGRTHDDRRDDEQRGTDQRVAPAADEGRDEERQRHDDGGDREDRLAGDHGVGADVAGTGDALGRLDERAERSSHRLAPCSSR